MRMTSVRWSNMYSKVINLFAILYVGASVAHPYFDASNSLNGLFSPHYGGNVSRKSNLVELAKRLNLTALVSALEQTKLANTLDHEGPFTLFAPTNDAFNRRPDYCFNVPLKDVMKIHVGLGSHFSKQLKNNDLLPTLLSERTVRINIYQDNQATTANGRELIKTDLVASNGVLHILKDVMCSLYIGSVILQINRCPAFSMFSRAVNLTDLYPLLDAKGPYTVFVPTDKAVAKLPHDMVHYLVKNRTALREVLLYHVLPQVLYSAGLQNGQRLKTLQGSYLTVSLHNVIKVNDAVVTLADATASNGVVHSIDTVLLPPSWQKHYLYK